MEGLVNVRVLNVTIQARNSTCGPVLVLFLTATVPDDGNRSVVHI